MARENGAVIEALPADGVAVFPADDAYTPLWRALAGARRMLTFALRRRAADVHAPTPTGTATHWALHAAHAGRRGCAARCTSPARTTCKNALAAAACALAAGVPLARDRARAWQRFAPVKGRSQRCSAGSAAAARVTLVDDTYNANPDSVRAAIDVLAGLPGAALAGAGRHGRGRRPGRRQFHAEVGAYARAARHRAAVDASGAQCAARRARLRRRRAHFDDVAALHRPRWPQLPACGSVLVKGSRFMKMERVVQAMRPQRCSQLARTEARHAA